MTWRHEIHAMLDEWFASRAQKRRFNKAAANVLVGMWRDWEEQYCADRAVRSESTYRVEPAVESDAACGGRT